LQVVTTLGALVAVLQVTLCQPLAAAGSTGLHEATGVGPLAVTEHVVVVQLLPAEGPPAVQVPACTPTSPATTGHVVVVQPLPAVAALAVHADTGTFVVLLLVHAVAVQALPAPASDATQVCTGTLVVLFAAQVVLVQPLPLLGIEALQLDTATSTVST
jgi:hypothetical protein